MTEHATITVASDGKGGFTASVSPAEIQVNENKDCSLDIETEGWAFDPSASKPSKLDDNWVSLGHGLYIEYGSDFTVKDKSNGTSLKLKDSGADKGSHPKHKYLVCLTDGSSHINTDPVIIDKGINN